MGYTSGLVSASARMFMVLASPLGDSGCKDYFATKVCEALGGVVLASTELMHGDCEYFEFENSLYEGPVDATWCMTV